MSDPTHRFIPTRSLLGHLLIAFGLSLFALPAMASKDCWSMWTPRGPISNYLQASTPETISVYQDCRDTYGDVAAATYAAVAPIAQKPRDYSDYTQTTELFPEGCTPGEHAGRPTATCFYKYRNTYVRKLPPYEVSYGDGEDFFELLMTCGERFRTKALTKAIDSCKPIIDRDLFVGGSCPIRRGVGNPIEPLTGLKQQPEDIFGWGRGHALKMNYLSLPMPESGTIHEGGSNSFGRYWFSNLHKQWINQGNPKRISLFQRGLGAWKSFGDQADPTERDPWPQVGGQQTLYFDPTERAIEVYRADGTLASIAYIDGRRLDYTVVATPAGAEYSESRNLVSVIRDEAGRQIAFQYKAVDPKYAAIQSITDPAGVVLPLTYDDAGNLTSITYADQTTKRFLYENTSFRHLLTGRLDEGNGRIGTYRYDDQGRAIFSQTGSLNGWTITWPSPPKFVLPTEVYDPDLDAFVRLHVRIDNTPMQALVTAPDGRQSTWDGTVVGNLQLLGAQSQPAGAGCAASTSASAFDAAANVTRSDDFNGNRSCMAYDPARNVETQRIEGLSSATACETVSAASLPTGARMISSQWHPDWRLATRTAEPRRITTLVYNGQPDPFNGNAVASCAPTSALLPDGKPIVVLCKRVEQATTDESGAQGFNATLQSGVPARATSWTYDATGQVLTETDPRGTVVVTNEYYTDTTAEHTKGDLKSSMNSAGHLTQFPRYNAYGKPLEAIDANLVSTTYAYDARQRLTSVSTGGSTTSYEYWPTGLLKKTTQPDGAIVTYEYDDAHRLTAVADGQGNRIEYTLDQSGNRTAEAAKDPQGTLKRTLARVYDALGRAQQTTGRE